MSDASVETPANLGPREPNNDMVICPNCTCQFVAIPVNVQKRLSDAPDETKVCNGKCRGHSSELSLSGWLPDPECPLHGYGVKTTASLEHVAILRDIVNFAYAQGFHELGYDIVDAAMGTQKAKARRGSATERLHRLCDALSDQADESPFSREEWERIDKETVRLQNCLRHLSQYVAHNGDPWVRDTALAYLRGAEPPSPPDVRGGQS